MEALLDDECTEQELLFNAYLDGELSEGEVRAFKERLLNEPEFREGWEEFSQVMGGLRALPMEFAPNDFVDKVQSRIRTRSKGKFFADPIIYKQRTPYEVVAIVMLIVMASAYLFLGAPHDTQLQDLADFPRLEVEP
jgi:negative regulator of sigma E activity